MPARGARRNDEEHEDIAGASRKDRQGEIGGGATGLEESTQPKKPGPCGPGLLYSMVRQGRFELPTF